MSKQLFIARQLLIYSVAAVTLIVFGQNCSNGFGVDEKFLDFGSLGLSSSAEFISAKAILKNNCTSCHSGAGSASGSPMDLGTEQQFALSGLVVAGNPDQSKLIQRLRNFTGTSALTRDMPRGSSLSDSDYQSLRRWVMAMGTSSPSNSNPYACNIDTLDNKVMVNELQLLSDVQYSNTIKDFLALTVPNSASAIYAAAVAPIPIPTNSGARYPRNMGDLTPEKLQAFFNISDKLAAEVTNATYAQTFLNNVVALNPGACVNPSLNSLSSDCIDQVIRNLGLRLYHRPLLEGASANEVTEFKREFSFASDKALAISNLVMRMMMSQNFLFRMEDQEIESATNPKLLQLSSYSVANRLSYTFWNTMPDQSLLDMARNRNLQDGVNFSEAMNYVLSSPKIESSLKEFAYGYLLLNKTPVFNPNTTSLGFFNEGITFDANMTKAMNAEAQDLVSYVTRSNGKFGDLFTTDISFTSYAPLMQVYGVSAPAPANITSQNAVRMPAGTRAGILTRAALLSEGSGGQHLIHRAARIKRDLLCIAQPAAPANTIPPVPLTEQEFQTMTFRQRFTQNTGSGVCFSCHQSINPWGYPLSKYNGLGFYKQTEPAFNMNGTLTGAQLPLDSNSDLSAVLSGGGPVNDAIQFSEIVSNRPEAQTCFTKNYASYVLGHEPDLQKEGCRLNKMYNFIKSGSIKDAISGIATDLEFRHRKID